MSFNTPSSTALGWANFNTDYSSWATSGGADDALARALSDAQNGTSGAVPGGTIYFPPLPNDAVPANYGPFNKTHVITGSCALVSLAPDDVKLDFEFNPTGPGTQDSAFIITGPNVTIRGLQIRYGNNLISPTGGNVAAIQVLNTSGVVLDLVTIDRAFAAVDCVGSSVLCENVQVNGIPYPSGVELAFGFRAQPGTGSVVGQHMMMRGTSVSTTSTGTTTTTGTAGYALIPPFPDMSVQNAGVSNTEYGFYVLAQSGSGTGGIMRLRNVNAENCVTAVFVDGGAVLHSSATVADADARAPRLTDGFSGMGVFAGDHYSAINSAGMAVGVPPNDGNPERPSPALVGIVGTVLAHASRADAGLFLSSTASGAVVVLASAFDHFRSGILVGAGSSGSAAIVASLANNCFTGIVARTPSASVPASVFVEASTVLQSNALVDLPITGNPVRIHNSPPINPVGFSASTSVGVPPSGTLNDTGYDAVVYIGDRSGAGEEILDITVDGHDTGMKSTGSNAVYPIGVPANTTLGIAFRTNPATGVSSTWILN